MLTEHSGIRQVKGQRARRWFNSGDQDLIVWYDPDGSIYGFQLCYDVGRKERALTWTPDEGFSHNLVDDGEEAPLTYKRTAVLVRDGSLDIVAVSKRFLETAAKLPGDVQEFVAGKLQDYLDFREARVRQVRD